MSAPKIEGPRTRSIPRQNKPGLQKQASAQKEAAKVSVAHVTQAVGNASAVKSPKSVFAEKHALATQKAQQELNKWIGDYQRTEIENRRQSAVTHENGARLKKVGYLPRPDRSAQWNKTYASLAPLTLPVGQVPDEAWLRARFAEGNVIGAVHKGEDAMQWVVFNPAQVPPRDPNKKSLAREAVQRAVDLLRPVYRGVEAADAKPQAQAKPEQKPAQPRIRPARKSTGSAAAPRTKPVSTAPVKTARASLAAPVAAPAAPQSYLSDTTVKNWALAFVRDEFKNLDPKNKYGIKVKTVIIKDGKISGIEIFRAGSKTKTKTIPFPDIRTEGTPDLTAWTGTRLLKACGSDQALVNLFKKVDRLWIGKIESLKKTAIVPDSTGLDRQRVMTNTLAALNLATEIFESTAAIWDKEKVEKSVRKNVLDSAYLRSNVQDNKYTLPAGEETDFLSHYHAGTLKDGFLDGKRALDYIPALIVEAFRGMHLYMLNQGIDIQKVNDFLGSAGDMVVKEGIAANGGKFSSATFVLNPNLDKAEFGKILGKNRGAVAEFYAKVEKMIDALVKASGNENFKDMGKNIYPLLFSTLSHTATTMANALADLMPEEDVTFNSLSVMQQQLAHPCGAVMNDIFHNRAAYLG